MIRYATIGRSWITQEFIRGCALLGDKFRLEAVYSRDDAAGAEFARKFGCEKSYTDINELAADPEVDAVYIASPNAFHAVQSRILLSSGKHVICEKPITVLPEEFTELKSIADRRGVIYMEALMARHLPAWQTVRDMIKRLGRISHARFDFSQRSSKYDSLMSGRHENIFDTKMAAGALMDLGIYCVYPCLGWFGEPEEIYACCQKLFTGIDGEGTAILRYREMTAELTYSKTAESRIGSEILGENGTLVFPSISKLTNVRFISKDGAEEQITGDAEKHVLMSYEADKFYGYVHGETADYEEVSRLALQVNRTLSKIRNLSGIEFEYPKRKN